MLIELITPFILATSPATLPDAPRSIYDHKSQRSIYKEKNNQQLAYSTSTYGGTQTFDINGKPYDNDNDSDTM